MHTCQKLSRALPSAGITVKAVVTFCGLIGAKLPFKEEVLVTIYAMPQVGTYLQKPVFAVLQKIKVFWKPTKSTLPCAPSVFL